MSRIWLALPVALALTACGGGDNDGASISIKGGDGDVAGASVKDGRVAVRAPGFEGTVKLPKFEFGADNFEVDGLKLFPGSTIANLDVESGNGKEGSVRIDFDAPAAATEVQNWFREQMQRAGFAVELKDGALSGKTSDGSPFTLKLAPRGDGKSRGTLSVTGT
jgi:hypothetical protein